MHDDATLSNPCGEIALESYELCNLSEVFPTNCESEEEFYEVLEYATFYHQLLHYCQHIAMNQIK